MSDTAQGPDWWQGTDGKWYPPAAPTSSTSSSLRPSLFLVVGGALAMGVGAFLPWIKATAPFVGSITRSGVEDGGDGIFVVAMAIALLALAWPLYTGRPLSQLASIGVVLVALAGVALGFVDIADVTERVNDIKGNNAGVSATASVGVGLYLVIGGAVLAGVGGIIEWFKSASSK